MPSFAQEFTPELSEGYLANLLNQRNNQAAAEVGSARQEGAEAGLVGQAATGARVGAAVENQNKAIDDITSKFNLDVADKKYSERMTDEREAFQDVERQKNETFQRSMTEMGFNLEGAARNAQNREEKITGEQGMIEGGLMTMGVNAANPRSYMGGK